MSSKCKIISLGQIEQIIMNCSAIRPMFKGIYSIQEIGNLVLPINCYVIVCTLKLTQINRIGHFFGLYCNRLQEIEIYDSLATDINKFKELKLFIEKNAKYHYLHISSRIQALDSYCCSLYCLFFIYQRCVFNLSFEEIVKLFNNKTHQEADAIVYNFCKLYILHDI